MKADLASYVTKQIICPRDIKLDFAVTIIHNTMDSPAMSGSSPLLGTVTLAYGVVVLASEGVRSEQERQVV